MEHCVVFIVNSPQLGLGKLLMHGPLAGTLLQTFIIIIFLCHICCDYLLKMLVDDDGQSQHGELKPHDQVSTQRSSPVEELKGKGVRQLTVEHPLNGMADGGPTGFPTADDEPVVDINGDVLLGSPVEDLGAGTKKLKKKKKQQKLGVAAVPKGVQERYPSAAAMVFCGRRDFAHFRVASCLERCIAHLTPVLVMSKKYRALLRVGHDSFIGVYCNALR